MTLESLAPRLEEICAQSMPVADHASLLKSVESVIPGQQFQLSLSRSGWYRVGGLMDAEGKMISPKLDEWLEGEGLDSHELWDKYKGAGYQVTRQNGATLYFTASQSDDPSDFIQLEVEEISEVIHRNFLEPGHIPETREELMEPEEYTPLTSTDLVQHFYRFRRVTSIRDYVARMVEDSEFTLPIQRWFADWQHSSAGEKAVFCQQWVMALREYTDGYGEPRMEAKPIPCIGKEFNEALEELDPDNTMRGSTLANAIHSFDRQAGYPMAWYFFMLTRKKVSPRTAEAIHNDLQGAYAYLAPRDLKILNHWMAEPYSI